MIFEPRSRVFFLIGFFFLLASSGCRTTSGNTAAITQDNRKAYRPLEMQESITAADTSFDADKGEVRYTLPEPAYVRIRIGLDHGGALLHNLLDWDLRSAGAHVEKWDMKDSPGSVLFGKRADYFLLLNARPVNKEKGYEKSPQLAITFPDSKEQTAQGVPVVDGVVFLRVTLDEKDAQKMTEAKFEVAIYLDYGFFMEDEVGTNPFNYRIDAAGIGQGEHVVTVNIISYNGQVGTRSAKIFVK